MTTAPYDRETVLGMYRLKIALANLEDAIASLDGDVTEGEKKHLRQSLDAMQGRRLKMCERIGQKHGAIHLDCEAEIRTLDREASEDGDLYRDIGETFGYRPLGQMIAHRWNQTFEEDK